MNETSEDLAAHVPSWCSQTAWHLRWPEAGKESGDSTVEPLLAE
jgi:hypothetical protein